MRINVSGLLKSDLGSRREYRVRDNVSIAGQESLVEGEVSLMRTDQGILVRATLRNEVEVTCGRCLSSFCYPLTLSIEEEYFKVIDVVSGDLQSLPDEASRFTIDEHHDLDLTEAVRQYALLAIPMKPLCRDDCAGLCPTCGYNLNQGACSCSPQEVDPRWSKLSRLQFK